MLWLTLVRHASTRLNAEHRYQGWCDPPLSDAGRAEALRLRRCLAAEEPDFLLSGDSRRCIETAALALPAVTARLDPRLRELDFGAWDGLTYEECHAADPERLSAWIDDPSRAHPPGGESFESFCGRVDAVLRSLPAAGGVVVLTHGGPLRRLLCRVLGLGWEEAMRLRLSPCGITRLAIQGSAGRLVTLNDTAHLDGVA